jgi:hypothetical protein
VELHQTLLLAMVRSDGALLLLDEGAKGGGRGERIWHGEGRLSGGKDSSRQRSWRRWEGEREETNRPCGEAARVSPWAVLFI